MRRHIPDSPGFSRPAWMGDEEYAEFRMTPEYAYEVSRPEDEPEPYDDLDGDYADAMAEQDADQHSYQVGRSMAMDMQDPLDRDEAIDAGLDPEEYIEGYESW